MAKLPSDKLSPSPSDRMSPPNISTEQLFLVWSNSQPKPSRKKFRARLRIVRAA